MRQHGVHAPSVTTAAAAHRHSTRSRSAVVEQSFTFFFFEVSQLYHTQRLVGYLISARRVTAVDAG